jgi:polysaccharide export outer membrane protein
MIRLVQVRSLFAAVVLTAVVRSAGAQEPAQQPPPTRSQLKGLIARPEVVAQIRQQILAMGLTREQVHDRLRAQGYPEDMFDDYFPGARERPVEPSDQVYNALEELGIADRAQVEFLRLLQSDSTTREARDSLVRSRDTLGLGRREAAPAARRNVVRADVADSMIRLDSGYNIFGLEIFRANSGDTAKFNPLLAGPVDPNYRVGPGDQLTVILTGDVEATYPLEVQREGFIVIPQVGQIYVSNLTLDQLNDVLYTRLGRVYSGVKRGPGATTHFSVSVTKLRAIQVFVLGEVERPGSYQVAASGTAMTALYASGGPGANGSLRSVQIKRANQVVSTLDLYDYLLRGDASHDTRLQNGDIVFVPPRSRRVRILGEILRPATY